MADQLRIAILGTRGIPNNYSGFEQLAEYLSAGLVEKGHEVYVYNSHNHVYQEKEWRGVRIIHQHDPEYRMGTAGQFIYDLNCIIDSRKRKFDLILQLGYTSSTIWFFLMPSSSKVATNMDGLEWKRSKYNKLVQQFLKVAEWLAVISSDTLVADSRGIEDYLKKKYKKDSFYVAYGTEVFDRPDPAVLNDYKVVPGGYDMLIARMEPENNIKTILEGRSKSVTDRKFLVVGGYDRTAHGRYLKDRFESEHILFTGGIFDIEKLNNLRYYSNLYFHGHSVGGTNPSLLEAMGSRALICAHDNAFNRAILSENAYYFHNPSSVAAILDKVVKNDLEKIKLKRNLERIAAEFTWKHIVDRYERMMLDTVGKKGR